MNTEEEVVNRLLARCPDNPSREFLRALISLAYEEGKVVAGHEIKDAINGTFQAGEGKP
jgi:hypothetical protein